MEKEDRDLLIRIDERQENLIGWVKDINKKVDDMPCNTQAEKIRFHDKIIWGALLAAVAANVKAWWIFK